ncbi:CYTH domain-containing protein [Methylorubrum extorquens]|jgi:CYTH domain-containing protein|uniref:CYTH domain-containing protein n=1 Tax=Methylorubrum extorquens TaxID=408 RepID=UPI0015F7BC32|nr:CYTH domain-containing protein [Methylorubrum extorquens]MBA9067812.1 CYTH domain-containing protein [Methylobacterium sp. RAS18]MDH6638265.1 adenylate cyclase [Methylobacterium sp. SuP10 SLI 274]MDH6667445.1 adenylate cyclase [Methylorubrum zatmanii]MCP1537505.1 CYTH domain-containing protein [Methylorubrum extorquens]MCP1559346.1 CYTH domain-containing protein [Methylorubrum extorquens]
MRFEVERKFLVADDGWKAGVVRRHRLTDGLIGQFDTGKVRVRLDEDRAWLTIKGARVGLGRPEFEYEIPRADAEAMMRLVCDTCFIEKTRHCVPHAGLVWEIDVYGGTLAGMILAEVELEHEDQAFERPAWLGLEVTGDPRFRQSALLRRFEEAGRRVTLEEVLAAPL